MHISLSNHHDSLDDRARTIGTPVMLETFMSRRTFNRPVTSNHDKVLYFAAIQYTKIGFECEQIADIMACIFSASNFHSKRECNTQPLQPHTKLINQRCIPFPSLSIFPIDLQYVIYSNLPFQVRFRCMLI